MDGLLGKLKGSWAEGAEWSFDCLGASLAMKRGDEGTVDFCSLSLLRVIGSLPFHSAAVALVCPVATLANCIGSGAR